MFLQRELVRSNNPAWSSSWLRAHFSYKFQAWRLASSNFSPCWASTVSSTTSIFFTTCNYIFSPDTLSAILQLFQIASKRKKNLTSSQVARGKSLHRCCLVKQMKQSSFTQRSPKSFGNQRTPDMAEHSVLRFSVLHRCIPNTELKLPRFGSIFCNSVRFFGMGLISYAPRQQLIFYHMACNFAWSMQTCISSLHSRPATKSLRG